MVNRVANRFRERRIFAVSALRRKPQSTKTMVSWSKHGLQCASLFTKIKATT